MDGGEAGQPALRSAATRRAIWCSRLAALAVAAVLCAGQAGRWYPRLDIINALLIVFVPIVAALALFALIRRDRITLALLIVAQVMIVMRLGSADAGRAEDGATAARPVRIITFNVHRTNSDVAALPRVINRLRPDVVLLQEANGTAAAVIARIMPGYFRLDSCRWKPCSLVILSRWPIRPMTTTARFTRQTTPDLQLASIDHPARPFQIANLHMPRPTMGRIALSLRHSTIEALGLLPPAPTIVAGDFNLPPGTFALDDFERSSGLRRIDSLLPTYPADSRIPPLLAIDHVHADGSWTAGHCQRLAPAGSDHLGLLCELMPAPVCQAGSTFRKSWRNCP